MSDLRETILPVCKLVEVKRIAGAAGAGSNAGGTNASSFDLVNTALFVDKITISDTSGMPLGTSSFTASGGFIAGYPNAASCTFDLNTQRISTNQNGTTLVITNPGAYDANGAASGVDCSAVMNAGTSAVFAVTMSNAEVEVPYVSVTDLSGTNGFFRIQPSSGTGTALYLSSYDHGITASSTIVSSIDVSSTTSGIPGVIAQAGGTATLTLQPSQKVSAIAIENETDATTGLFAINYGVVKRANALRDQQLPDAK